MPPAGKNKATRGCWTCKDRRVRCDLGFPSCANCARVQQVRLSWPRAGDKKRSMVGGVPGSLIKIPKRNNFELVHTSAFDMEMYYYLVDLRPDSKSLDPRVFVALNAEELELLQYFHSTAWLTLATATLNPTSLRDLLIRLALSEHGTIPSRAVLHAILALSSLHRDNFQLQAAQHKTAAVGALGASVRNGINNTTEAAQHVATNMLLCSFEIHIGTDSHGHWPFYILGARDITKAAGLEAQLFRSDIRELILWTFYHDVLARFSLLHWRRESLPHVLAKELDEKGGWQRDLCAYVTKLKVDIGPLHRILRYLGDVVDALCCSIKPSDTLQEEIHAAELGVKELPASLMGEPSRLAALTELFRAAVLHVSPLLTHLLTVDECITTSIRIPTEGESWPARSCTAPTVVTLWGVQ
ncbi:hypothetical protein CIB48_g8223 [Xylaria polymorpha]|nr:hypothetical protein CIB48_g8223 [Xylaria polymorpha]